MTQEPRANFGQKMQALLKEIETVPVLRRFGPVARIEGLVIEVTGPAGAVGLGGQVRLSRFKGKRIPCEAVGFRDGRAQIMRLGAQIEALQSQKKDGRVTLVEGYDALDCILASLRGKFA